MIRKTLKHFEVAAIFILLLNMAGFGMTSSSKGTKAALSGKQAVEVQDRIQHSLRMLPYYGAFDRIDFAVQGDTVTLTGEVRRPLLKSEAERAVRKTEGVTSVVNNIEILPLSSMDDSLRLATYYAIYAKPGFEKYCIQAAQPIRIIVKNSNITLAGVVATEQDRILAEMAARNVRYALSITNNLTVD